MKNRNFSMLELLTVIFVIALLMALLLPSIARVKKMANLALCSKNLKDIHALAMAYSVDHDNTLPGGNGNDHRAIKVERSFYEGALGHLIPYVDQEFGRSDIYRLHKLNSDGKIVYEGVYNTPVTAKTTERSYQIVSDAINGTGIFKLFLCPEIVQNVMDPRASHQIPKINFLMRANAMPTTYMYNDDMMLRTNGDISLYMNTPDKISELQDFGKKVMFMEGGLNGNNGHNEGGFIRARNKVSYRFGFSEVPDGASQVGGRVMFTFAHDDEEEFWHSRMILDPRFQFRVNTFNDAFAPETYIAFGSANTGSGAGHQGEGGIYTHVSLVTHENPYNSSDYKNKTNRVLGFTWTSGFTYVGDDLLYKPSIGKSNVLYGDGSVKAEHVSWLFVNRIELLVTSKKAVQ